MRGSIVPCHGWKGPRSVVHCGVVFEGRVADGFLPMNMAKNALVESSTGGVEE